MKKLFCMLCCAMLVLSAVSCALAAEAGELATATSLKAYLPTVGWDDYTATDADGDGFDDETDFLRCNGQHRFRYDRHLLPVP